MVCFIDLELSVSDPFATNLFIRGKLVINRVLKKPTISCRNWECGVIIPIHTQGSNAFGNRSTKATIFEDVVPVPMKKPGRTIDAENSPWYFIESRSR